MEHDIRPMVREKLATTVALNEVIVVLAGDDDVARAMRGQLVDDEAAQETGTTRDNDPFASKARRTHLSSELLHGSRTK
jgi:hypothetical protein